MTTITRSTRILADWTNNQICTNPESDGPKQYKPDWSSEAPCGETYTPRILLEAMREHPQAHWRMWVKVEGTWHPVVIARADLVQLADYQFVDSIRA